LLVSEVTDINTLTEQLANASLSVFMSKLDFATAVAQEEARLRVLHPGPEDIPGCISVFDDYLSCNGAVDFFALTCSRLLNLNSHPQPNQVAISIWRAYTM